MIKVGLAVSLRGTVADFGGWSRRLRWYGERARLPCACGLLGLRADLGHGRPVLGNFLGPAMTRQPKLR
jgi:hypothetical protein